MTEKDLKLGIRYLQWLLYRAESFVYHVKRSYKTSEDLGTFQTQHVLKDTFCCALCLGVIDWHICGSILGACKFGWDSFVCCTHSVQYCQH